MSAVKGSAVSDTETLICYNRLSDAVKALRRLPHLFGGESVLSKASALCRNSRAEETIAYLDEIYSALCSLGLEKYVIFDLGMLQRNEYYTGIIFRGYIEGSGEIALSGGRYDALLKLFGSPEAAIGFAINADVLMRVLKERNTTSTNSSCELLIHPTVGFDIRALELVGEYTEKQVPCEFSLFDSIDEAVAYGKSKGIRTLLIMGDTIEKISLSED